MSAATKAPVTAIALELIHESPDNPRKFFDAAFVDRMARSMAELGQLTRATVRPHPTKPGHYELAAGATRRRAAKLAGLTVLDCDVRDYDDTQFLEALTFENLERTDLRPLEEARSYALLMKKIAGYTVERIATRSGVSPDYVRDRVRLLRLGASAMQLLEEQEIELGHAIELAKLNTTQQMAAIRDGLFVPLRDAQHSALLQLGEPPKRKTVTVHELRAWIDKHVLADLSHPDVADLFPETAKLLERGKLEKIPQVFIATGYVLPEVKRGVEVLTPANWKRADGQGGSKTCDRPKKIGIVAASDAARTQGFLICTSKVCPVHFPDQVRRAKQRAQAETKAVAKGKPVASAAEAEQRRRDADAKADAARKAKTEAIAKTMPAIEDAVLTAIAKVNSLTLLRMTIEDFAATTYTDGPAEQRLLRKLPATTVEGGLRRLFFLGVMAQDGTPFDEYGLNHWLPGFCKRLGIDLKRILAAAVPAPAKVEKKAPAKKAAKKKARAKAGAR